MPGRSSDPLNDLEALRFAFGGSAPRRKLALLEQLRETELASADAVLELHELLRFMRAYPDNREVLEAVERLLTEFPARADLDFFRPDLVNTGMAGTEVHFRFYWFTLGWLADRCGDCLRVDWQELRGKNRALLDRRLTMLMPFNETLALEEGRLGTREWVERLKGPKETDAQFLVKRFRAMKAESIPREVIFEEIDVPFRLLPGPKTPSTTLECYRSRPVVFQKKPPESSRKTFHRELKREPKIRSAGRREARTYIDMARTLMVVRERDLDAFVHADAADVRVFEYPEGIQFVSYGAVPERRQMLDAAYGFLILRNGLTTGYVLAAGLFNSAEVAYNISPPFRGAEAAHLYGRSLGVVHRLMNADSFVVDPYQMGYENQEGLRSGAWWFYYKLGFRPRDPVIAKAAEAENERVQREQGYRTSLTKLNRLASVNMYLQIGEPRDDVIGEFARENVGLKLVDYMARRFGGDRERGRDVCSREAAAALGVTPSKLSAGERTAWDRWAPVACLIGAEAWPERDRRALAAVIRAKGGRRESDFIDRFDRHRRLRRAVWQLSQDSED